MSKVDTEMGGTASSKPMHSFCMQIASSNEEQHLDELSDFQLSSSGKLIASGAYKKGNTFIKIYELPANGGNILLYSQEFDRGLQDEDRRRFVSFMSFTDCDPNYFVTGSGKTVEILRWRGMQSSVKITYCVVEDNITSLLAREENIYVYLDSFKLKILDKQLVCKKTFHFKGCFQFKTLSSDDYSTDVAIEGNNLLVCPGRKSKNTDAAVCLVLSSGNEHSRYELKSSFWDRFTSKSDACSIAACKELGLVVVVWKKKKIVIYPFNSRKPFAVYNVDKGVSRIRISSTNKMIVTGNGATGEIKFFYLEKFITCYLMKTYLASNFPQNKLANFLNRLQLESDKFDEINKQKPKRRMEFLLFLYEDGDGKIPRSDVMKIKDALKDDRCSEVVSMYLSTRRNGTTVRVNINSNEIVTRPVTEQPHETTFATGDASNQNSQDVEDEVAHGDPETSTNAPIQPHKKAPVNFRGAKRKTRKSEDKHKSYEGNVRGLTKRDVEMEQLPMSKGPRGKTHVPCSGAQDKTLKAEGKQYKKMSSSKGSSNEVGTASLTNSGHNSPTRSKTKTTEEKLRPLFEELSLEIDDYRNVGRKLALKEGHFHQIETKWKGKFKEASYQMLLLWSRREGSDPPLHILSKALEKADRKDLAEKVEEYSKSLNKAQRRREK